MSILIFNHCKFDITLAQYKNQEMWYDANETTLHKRPNDTDINNNRLLFLERDLQHCITCIDMIVFLDLYHTYKKKMWYDCQLDNSPQETK